MATFPPLGTGYQPPLRASGVQTSACRVVSTRLASANRGTLSTHLRSELVAAARQGHAVFIVGAGASLMSSGGAPVAGWRGLIEDGLRRCVDLDASRSSDWLEAKLSDLKTGDTPTMIRVAQEVEDLLKRIPGRQYAKWLADSVGSLRIAHPQLVDALGGLEAPLVTTNYDSLLELGTRREPVSWDQFADMQAELLTPGRYVIHLHGHWRRPDTVVFGYETYASVVGDPAAQAFLRALLAVKSVVFVGFGQGVVDPNFSALTTWLTTVLRPTGVAPLMLVRDDELAASQVRYHPLGINVLSYGPEYEDLALYLADIATESRIGRDARPTIEYSWDSLSAKLRRLQRRITRSFSPDFVVAISGPGNFAPAYCLAHWSDEPPLLTAVSFPREPSRSAKNLAFAELAAQNDWIHYESTKWDVFLPDIIRSFPAGSKVLLFDDRVIGRRTQPAVAKILEGFGYEVRRAALVVDPSCVDVVDYYEEVVEGDFTFPWGGRYGRGERPS